MTSRAILLPTTGDPFITACWLESYRRFQKEYIDQLYVCVNSPTEDKVFNYVVDMFEAEGAKVIKHHNMLDHGPAITKLVEECKEDYIFLSEDDFYLQIPEQLDDWFKPVEEGDVGGFGSMRGCVGAEIINATTKKFGLKGHEVAQPNFWPALFLASKENFLKTDMNFAGKIFKAGEYIPQLDFTPTVDTGGDTFVWASIQFRALGLYIHQVYHHRWIDVLYNRLIPPPWIHIGSSSTSMNGHLLDETMRPIANPEAMTERTFPPVPDAGIKTNYETIFAGWDVLNEAFPIDSSSPASYFNKVYKDSVARNISGCGLDQQEVNKNKQLFRQILAPILS